MHIEVASFVSKRPYSKAVVSACFIAAAVRTIIASATPQAPELRRPSDVAVRLQSDEPATVMRSPFNKDQALDDHAPPPPSSPPRSPAIAGLH
jgi:hypothetical protein